MFKLVRCQSSFGEYQGLLHDVGSARTAIHVHGTWGNFYENAIATHFADLYARRGYNFASVNVPGRDYESVHERFADSHEVLSSWVETLAPKAESLIWQGHSLGALKVAKHVLIGSDPAPRALVLMSPFDIRSFNARTSDEDVIRQKFEVASAATGDDQVDTSLFDVWPISNATYAACLSADGHLAIFRSGQDVIGSIGEMPVPTIAFVGGDDFAQSPDADSAASVLSRGREIHVELVAGAPHNFAGFERTLAARLEAFLESLD